jgi:RNA polymerase sigma factor (sigma-70 family)
MLAAPQAMSSAAVLPSSDPVVPESEVTVLTRRLVVADDAAWSEAHARYAPRLFRYLLVAARGDEQAARDALQGAFVRAVRHARVFSTEEAIWGWFTLLARHTLADARRSTSRWRAFLDRFRDAPASEESNAEGDPLSDRLDEALSRLSDPDRVLLEQKYFEAATVRDLAAAANTSEKAIESRLARARNRLRSILLEPLQP